MCVPTHPASFPITIQILYIRNPNLVNFSRTILFKGICKREINLMSLYHTRKPPIRKLHNSTENSPGDTSGFCTYTVPLHTSSACFLVPITDQPFHTEAFVQSKKKKKSLDFLCAAWPGLETQWWVRLLQGAKKIISVRKARENKEIITETGSLDVTSAQAAWGLPGCAWEEDSGEVASSLRMRRHSEAFTAFLISCTHELVPPEHGRDNTGIPAFKPPQRARQTKLNIMKDILAQNGVPNYRYKVFI